MERVALYKCVIGLDVHQAQITACALIEDPDGSMRIEQRQLGGFKRDRREQADWMASLRPDEVVMESTFDSVKNTIFLRILICRLSKRLNPSCSA